MQPAQQYRNYPPAPAALHPAAAVAAPTPLHGQRPAPHAVRRQQMPGGGGHHGPQNLAAMGARDSALRDINEQKRATQNARNRSIRPVDRDLPSNIDDLVIGDGIQLYKKLREVERRLDSTMSSKRLDIQDSVHRGSKKYGTMRIWISNTVDNQPWQTSGMDPEAFDFGSNVEASFRVKIEGRLLDEDSADSSADELKTNPAAGESAAAPPPEINDEGEPAAKRPKLSLTSHPSPAGRKRFSRFFKSITIDFDRSQSLQPDGYTRIEWVRPDQLNEPTSDLPKNADFDTLEFERKSDENINININLVLDEQPERYRLAQPLAELLDMEEADRTTVLLGLWEYSRLAGLQGDDDGRHILCDDRLREIFQVPHLEFPKLPEMIKPFLFDPPPISLPYTIRVDKAFHGQSPDDNNPTQIPTIYDIRVPIEDPLLTEFIAQTRSPNHGPALQEIARIDANLALLVQHMNHSKAKHGFYTSMGNDPANFIKRWISSQKRDLDVIMGAGVWGEEDWQSAEWRNGGTQGPWGSDEAWEGVGLYLAKNRA